ncbi:MAG: hypothetical protein J6U54_07995 [Clostridiales bacterium]|nr:hypothetical protein [Clostridiales bacterium]
MSERIIRDLTAFKRERAHVLSIIECYRKTHKPVYVSFEKNFVYDWTLKEAQDTIAMAYGKRADTPLNVLERLLVKYDTWAHTESRSAEQFKVAAAAIEDLIDLILTS